jgi:hypothetical protein
VGSGGEGICPICGRHRGLEEQCTSDIVSGAKHAFGLAILRRGVGARHAERDTVSEKEGAGVRVIELAAIVALHSFDGTIKLSVDIGKKIGQSGESIRFQAEGKCSQKMGAIINNDQIVFKPRHTDNRRGP